MPKDSTNAAGYSVVAKGMLAIQPEALRLLDDLVENLSEPGVAERFGRRERVEVCKACGGVAGHTPGCRFHEFKVRAIALGLWPLTRL